jgi:CO dehydrogenase maturation factor
MTITIALAGKGGVGKTTLAALMIKYLLQTQPGAVLAIDADPSTNLNLALGLEVEATVGDIREGLLQQVKSSLASGGAAMGTLPGGETKREYLDYQVRASLSEGERCDLIAMGRPEGPGCYCAVNHNLREVVDSLSKHYAYVVIDNEAGMEHLSRRTTRAVDHLVIISDPSYRGVIAAGRIAGFRNELDIELRQAGLVLNRLVGPLAGPLQDQVAALGIPLLGSIPADETVAALEYQGRPVVDLPADSPVYRAVVDIMKKIGVSKEDL